ncbi:MAG: double zinc ribbon domain-containing protein [Cellulosilyticaceae bacterium]
MIGGIAILCMVGLVLVMMVSMLVIIGRTVYKDAKALGLNAVMWTVIAVFLPNLIGVIIYLVVRSNTPKKMKCSKCERLVDEAYNVCPECGSTYTSFCKACKKPIQAGMKLCPYCGETAEELEQPTAHKVQIGTNIGKTLGITFAVFFGTMLLIVFGMVGIGLYSQTTGYTPNISVMNTQSNFTNNFKNKFFYREGREKITFKFEDPTRKVISGMIAVEEGAITLRVENEQEQEVYTGVFRPQEMPYTIAIDLSSDKGKVYRAYIEYDDARGKIELSGK